MRRHRLMFFDEADKWLVKSNRFPDVFHNLEVYFKLLLTYGLRKSFWCDGHLWLCYCCHKLRRKIRRDSWRHGTITIYKGNKPYHFKL